VAQGVQAQTQLLAQVVVIITLIAVAQVVAQAVLITHQQKAVMVVAVAVGAHQAHQAVQEHLQTVLLLYKQVHQAVAVVIAQLATALLLGHQQATDMEH